MMDAGMAVRTFFTISGFYMTLILTSKYHATDRAGYRLFISNRLLRIVPSYYVVLGLSLAFYAAASFKLQAPADRLQYWVDAWNAGHWPELAAILISQFTIVGLDVTPMFDFSPSRGFGWVTTLGPEAIRAWRFNFMPHCWSISVELIFYFFAPFLCLLRKSALMALIASGGLLHLGTWLVLPWDTYLLISYHFTPFQFPFLLLGVLAFHVFRPVLLRKDVPATWYLASVIPMAVLVFFSGWIRWDYLPLVVMAVSFFAVPLLFRLTGKSRIDRFVGDLSYPMYLTHIFGKWVILAAMGVSKKDAAVVPGWLLLIVTVALSVPLVLWLERPIDRWRQARLARQLPAGNAPA